MVGRVSVQFTVSKGSRWSARFEREDRLVMPRQSMNSIISVQLRDAQSVRVRSLSLDKSSIRQARRVIVLPGFLNRASSYAKLAKTLSSLGYDAVIAPITGSDWTKVIAGSDFRFYLDKIEDVLVPYYEESGAPCSLVGHSAGGWIGRLLLGNIPYQGKVYGHADKVDTLITLGTPHFSLEDYPFGRVAERLVVEQQNVPAAVLSSSLRFTNHYYPTGDSFPGVKIVTVAGNAIRGRPLGLSILRKDNVRHAVDSFLAYQSYKAGCGDGSVEGDGVTPICIAHLDKAYANITLNGVWHGPRSSTGRPWYGDVVDQWASYLNDENVLLDT